MAKQIKIKNKNRSFHKFLQNFFKPLLIILAGAFIISIPKLLDREAEIPLYSPAYSVSPVSCVNDATSGTRIKLKFQPFGAAQYTAPAYSIEEITQKGKTVIAFENSTSLIGEFAYNDVIADPLVELLDYYIKDGKLVIEITRRGNYLPAQIISQGPDVTIILPPGNNNFPAVVNEKPARESAAFPARHPVSFDAVLNGAARDIYVFFNNEPAQFAFQQTATSTWAVLFEKELQNETEYTVKTIITDDSGRTAIASWNFTGRIPSAAILGKNRFEYLGWWGQINASGVAIRKGAGTSFDKIGVLSSAERVKVLEEIFGGWVDGKNLWYKIDGGKYAGNYIFADYVTPMSQPEPPAVFSLPEGVDAGENWIDVDLTKKVLTLFSYDKPIFATYIASGRTENPTRTGTYRVWYKLKKTEMQGGPPLHTYRYHLKDIPWTMYYNFDYAIHGTYWHDKFGTQQSAGCTNMTQGDAKYIFDNTLPAIPEGKDSIFARDEYAKGTGTVVYNHE